jgi:hypothetical protein
MPFKLQEFWKNTLPSLHWYFEMYNLNKLQTVAKLLFFTAYVMLPFDQELSVFSVAVEELKIRIRLWFFMGVTLGL